MSDSDDIGKIAVGTFLGTNGCFFGCLAMGLLLVVLSVGGAIIGSFFDPQAMRERQAVHDATVKHAKFLHDHKVKK